MTQPKSSRVPTPRPAPPPNTARTDAPLHEHDPREHPAEGTAQHGHSGHRLMMIACCIPMLVIVGVLVATGVAGSGAILYALICLAGVSGLSRASPVNVQVRCRFMEASLYYPCQRLGA